MLKDIDYDDQAVADYLVEGVKVVGNLDRTGIWQNCDKLATCSQRILWEGAKRTQSKLLEPRSPTEIDAVVWDKTCLLYTSDAADDM
eukprot:10911992-Karenia_brevis.AAC.1